jgi:formamidopyrimidine-DNA glycosylase
MPELPDIEVYREAILRRVRGVALDRIRLRSPFLLRTVEPAIEVCFGRIVIDVHRVGKRIAMELQGGPTLVIHLMIAGRLHWKPLATALNKNVLAAFDFERGSLQLTEAGSKKRASLHVLADVGELKRLDPGGLEPLTCSPEEFAARLRSENHTLKRSLTDPHLFSGIGNSYSDEILHRAKLSPVTLTSRLSDDDAFRLHAATVETLNEWLQLLRKQTGDDFPEGVTAFRPEMAVHGRFGKPCPVCGTAVQRIRYSENETNYCPRCQTGGKVLADRSLSRLLKEDWPRSIEELEEMWNRR